MLKKSNGDMFKKNKNSESKIAIKNAATMEFNERVSRLLMVCIDGICQMIPKKEALYAALKNLGDVVRKANRPKPLTDMGKDIEDFFKRQILEARFRDTKNETMKQIVLELSETIQEITTTAGDFNHKMERSVEEIQKASDIEDIVGLKDRIIKEIGKVRNSSLTMKKEMDEHKMTTHSLSTKLKHTEAKILVDSLTNLLNRSAYDMKISQSIREFSELGEPFCLMVIDIDHFKKVNDQYGHKVGDLVLRSVSESVKEVLRNFDLVFRYGGEEFVVILKGIQLDDAAQLAERIRKGVEKDYYVHKSKKMKFTISLGIACVKKEDTELSLFERADKALFVAKRQGKNRVVIEGL